MRKPLARFSPARFEETTRKTLWRSRTRPIWEFLCPLCKTHRRVPFRSRPGGPHLIQIGLTSVVFMIFFWHWFSWKGIVSFIPFWTAFEMIYRWRMRSALNCPHCGFDPYLFLIDHELAKQEVDAYWRKKFAEKGIPYPEKGVQQTPSKSATPHEAGPLPSTPLLESVRREGDSSTLSGKRT